MSEEMSEVYSGQENPLVPKDVSNNPMQIGEEEIKELLTLLKQRMRENEMTVEGLNQTDDVILTRYIVGKKGDVEKAFKALFYTAHGFLGALGNIVPIYDPLTFTSDETGSIRLLRRRDKLGRLVVVLRIFRFHESLTTVEQLAGEIVYAMHSLLRFSDICCKRGIVIISDAKGLKWRHLKLIRSLVATGFKTIQELLGNFLNTNPMRLKGYHIVNHSRVLSPFVTLLHSFLPPKLKKRVHHHNHLDSLHEYFEPDSLPKALGGNLEEDDAYDPNVKEMLAQNVEYFEKFKTMGKHLRLKFDGEHVGYDPQKCSGKGCGREKWM